MHKHYRCICWIMGISILCFLGGCGKQKNSQHQKETIGEKKEKTSDTLQWALYEGAEISSAIQKELNQRLIKKGLKPVEFVTVTPDYPEYLSGDLDYEKLVQYYLEQVEEGNFDLVTVPGISGNFDYYSIFVKAGALEPLGDYLNSGTQGGQLKNAYSNKVWEKLEYERDVYGVLTALTNFNCYLVANQDLAEQYGIDMETLSLDNWQDIVATVGKGEQEKGNHTFLPIYDFPAGRSVSRESALCDLLILDTFMNCISLGFYPMIIPCANREQIAGKNCRRVIFFW